MNNAARNVAHQVVVNKSGIEGAVIKPKVFFALFDFKYCDYASKFLRG